jgi:hypothetical protein
MFRGNCRRSKLHAWMASGSSHTHTHSVYIRVFRSCWAVVSFVFRFHIRARVYHVWVMAFVCRIPAGSPHVVTGHNTW